MRQYLYTLTESDIGKTKIEQPRCSACGQQRPPILLHLAINRVQKNDVGKRVYDVDGCIQVENDRQRDNRGMIKIEIDTRNDAFQGDDYPGEVSRILTDLAKQCTPGCPERIPLFDVNGNLVGQYERIEPQKE